MAARLDDEGVIRGVAWAEVFPWLNLARCLRLSLRFHALLLSTVAVLATVCGWSLLALVFQRAETQPDFNCPWLALTRLVPDQPGIPPAMVGWGRLSPPPPETAMVLEENAPRPELWRSSGPFGGTWEHLGRPGRALFDWNSDLTDLAYYSLCGVWGLMVWAGFGGAITRFAAVELATGERWGWRQVCRYTAGKWLSYVGAPLLPLLVVAVAALASGLFGLMLRFGLGTLLASLLWPLMLVAWAVMTLLLVGLLFGWPLMWATISVEGTDSFDALSRANNYTFHRPLHYLFYAVVASLLGMLGWWLVSNLAASVVYLAYWSASWGGGSARLEQIREASAELGSLSRAGAYVILFWTQCVKLAAVGYLYSFFWNASTGIYFLLRRDVDHREMDEVFFEDDQGEAGLPPLKSDPAGAPVVDEKAEEQE